MSVTTFISPCSTTLPKLQYSNTNLNKTIAPSNFHPRSRARLPSFASRSPATTATDSNRRRRHQPCAHRRQEGAHEAPDYEGGFDPSVSKDYHEVRPFSFGPSRHNCALLTLLPIPTTTTDTTGEDNPQPLLAFKMSVTMSQAEAIRRALHSTPTPTRTSAQKQQHDRPSTHDLTKNIIDATGCVVSQAAITHMVGDVFIARVWLRRADGEEIIHIDARPSDALALSAHACAPLFLHKSLLKKWGVRVEQIRQDARDGRCELVTLRNEKKSTSSLKADLQNIGRDVFGLAVLKSRLDLAVRMQRFGEAAQLRDRIERVCPVDMLQRELGQAIKDERFSDAAKLQDELVEWKARLRMWERGVIDLERECERKLRDDGSEDRKSSSDGGGSSSSSTESEMGGGI